MSYPGGKNGDGVYQAIINQIPPHSTYIEPFLGGGAILRLKTPARLNIGLDLDAEVIRWFKQQFRGVQHRRKSSGRPETPKRAMPAGTAAPGDRRSLTASSGDGCRRASPDLALGAIAHPATAGESIWCFKRTDALEYLAALKPEPGTFVYCDPPYMHETRGRSNIYRYEMTDAQHRELLRTLKRLPCNVLLSGYWTALYTKALKSWRTVTFNAVNRAGARTTEYLWANYSEPLELHDWRYLGSNFRERERIKRKKLRWARRLAAMPLLERRALMWAVRWAFSGHPGTVITNAAAGSIVAGDVGGSHFEADVAASGD